MERARWNTELSHKKLNFVICPTFWGHINKWYSFSFTYKFLNDCNFIFGTSRNSFKKDHSSIQYLSLARWITKF